MADDERVERVRLPERGLVFFDVGGEDADEDEDDEDEDEDEDEEDAEASFGQLLGLDEEDEDEDEEDFDGIREQVVLVVGV